MSGYLGVDSGRRTIRRAAAGATGISSPRPGDFIPWFGDASLALGRAAVLRRRGVLSLANVVPYGCLPGTTSEAVFVARRDIPKGLPALHLALDGGPAAEVRAKVRALLDAVRAYRSV